MKECCREFLNGQFGGDEDIVNEIYAEYVSSTHQKIQDSLAQLSSHDWGLLDRTAHTLKGNALAAGDADLANVAIELRSAAKLQNEEEASKLISQMKDLAAGL